MIDKTISSRLDILRFPLILGVVFIHDGNIRPLTANAEHGGVYAFSITTLVFNLISDGVARSAVPLFFLMSSYLLCDKRISFSQGYFREMKKRLRTLLVPFLFWNISTFLGFAIGEHLPMTQKYFAGVVPIIKSASLFDHLDAIVGITGSPAAYQFWFIRDLIVLVLLSPLIVVAVRGRMAEPFLTLISLLWFSDKWPLRWPSIEATLFFSLGAYISVKRVNLRALDDRGGGLLILFIPALVVYSILASVSPSELSSSAIYIQKVVIILGVAMAWWLTSRVVEITLLKSWLTALSGSSFFVFAAHEPLMILFRKLAFRVVPPVSDAPVLLLYFSIPIILVVLLVVVYRVLDSRFPTLISVVTGGRGKRQLRKETFAGSGPFVTQSAKGPTAGC